MMPPLQAGRETPRLDAPNFDRLAPLYRWMEFFSFGPWLDRCRRAYLAEMAGCRRALVLGDGDGRFTARLLSRNRSICVDALDISPAMLKALLRRAGKHAHRVQARVADLRGWRLEPRCAQYDAVVTHFFLDCLTTEEAGSLARTIRGAAAPGALWVVSEFAVPAGWFGRLVAAPVVALLYRAFRWMTGLRVATLPEYRRVLGECGFEVIGQQSWLGGLLVSELWQLLPQFDGVPEPGEGLQISA